jgi:hypothetical protein
MDAQRKRVERRSRTAGTLPMRLCSNDCRPDLDGREHVGTLGNPFEQASSSSIKP